MKHPFFHAIVISPLREANSINLVHNSGKRYASNLRRIGKKRSARHTGKRIGFQHPKRSVLFENEIGTRYTSAPKCFMSGDSVRLNSSRHLFLEIRAGQMCSHPPGAYFESKS